MKKNDNKNEEYVVVEMTEEDIKKNNRKKLKLLLGIGITLIVLIVATYAWFFGNQTVMVNDFDVEIESLKGLEISLDGNNFQSGDDNPVIIKRGDPDLTDGANYNKKKASEDPADPDAYYNKGIANNHWALAKGGEGLSPVSSSGELSANGHLMFYENASSESLTGGYIFRSARVANDTADRVAEDSDFDETTASTEKDQYVTFDLFLRNNANTEVVSENVNDLSKGEPVYLTTNSKVVFDHQGNDEPSPGASPVDTNANGVENSVRVGFYEMSYISGSTITDTNETPLTPNTMLCARPEGRTSYTGLCGNSYPEQGVAWNIWEPNDDKHTTKADGEYAKCKLRTGAEVYSSDACSSTHPLINASTGNGVSLSTYAVNTVFGIDKKVNIYDGNDLNGYAGSLASDSCDDGATPTPAAKSCLKEVETIKETDNVIDSTNRYLTDRPVAFRLMPNSVTRIRVYIWLEGQDPDSFDPKGSNVHLKFSFGFTKDLYEEINDDMKNPPSPSADTATEETSNPEEPEEP